MEEHPSPEDLRRFVEGRLDRDEARRVVAHFIDGCRVCGDEAVRYNLMRLSVREQVVPASNNRPAEMSSVLMSVLQGSDAAPPRRIQ
jgi:anti-sigma factor ChrR (cupin superfamily)